MEAIVKNKYTSPTMVVLEAKPNGILCGSQDPNVIIPPAGIRDPYNGNDLQIWF